jgi:hypothetical protein
MRFLITLVVRTFRQMNESEEIHNQSVVSKVITTGDINGLEDLVSQSIYILQRAAQDDAVKKGLMNENDMAYIVSHSVTQISEQT